MQKKMVGVLVRPEIRMALEAACEREGRSLSAMAERLLIEGLQRGGFLPSQERGEARQERQLAA